MCVFVYIVALVLNCRKPEVVCKLWYTGVVCCFVLWLVIAYCVADQVGVADACELNCIHVVRKYSIAFGEWRRLGV